MIVVLSVFSLGACSSIPIPEAHLVTWPEVGLIATAGIGEPLLTQGIGISFPTLVLPKDERIGDALLSKGEYKHSYQKAEFVAFYSEKPGYYDDYLYVFNKDKKSVCVYEKKAYICAAIDFTFGKNTSFQEATFQQTLLYSGKIGNRITLGYREFGGHVARPAFSNDVAYDLSESSILGYKGARLEVIKANNTDITYRVIAGFQ